MAIGEESAAKTHTMASKDLVKIILCWTNYASSWMFLYATPTSASSANCTLKEKECLFRILASRVHSHWFFFIPLSRVYMLEPVAARDVRRRVRVCWAVPVHSLSLRSWAA
jgi:hypothetical protein